MSISAQYVSLPPPKFDSLQVSPIVTHCPPLQWEAWLTPLVPPVLAQAHTTLAGGWAQLATQTGGPPLQQTKGGAAEEILLDKMVRDLSRCVCMLSIP